MESHVIDAQSVDDGCVRIVDHYTWPLRDVVGWGGGGAERTESVGIEAYLGGLR